MKTKNQTSINKTASKVWLTDAELKALSNLITGQPKIIFQLMIATGMRFRAIKKTRWDSFNSRLATLDIDGVKCRLPVATAEALEGLRETAKSEDSPIFKVGYKTAWDKTSRAYFKLGIEQKHGCLKIAKWTFARRHYEAYRNKTHLAKAMGLTTTRWIPKKVFEYSGPQACLVQF